MKRVTLIFFVLAAVVFSLIGCKMQEKAYDGQVQTEETQQDIGIEERKRMDLYIAVMEAAFQEENGGKAFIAVKLDSLEGLSDVAKDKLLKELTGLSPNVYNFENVKNDDTKFILDKEGRLAGSINGTLLGVEVEDYDTNESTITGISWFGNLGAVLPKYKAIFKNGKWQLELISMAIS